MPAGDVPGCLSPGLASREQSAIEEACQKKRGLAPSDEDAKTGELLSISTDSSGDTVTVQFVSTWSPVAGNGKPQRRVQNWCFHRPASARTLQTEAVNAAPTAAQPCPRAPEPAAIAEP